MLLYKQTKTFICKLAVESIQMLFLVTLGLLAYASFRIINAKHLQPDIETQRPQELEPALSIVEMPNMFLELLDAVGSHLLLHRADTQELYDALVTTDKCTELGSVALSTITDYTTLTPNRIFGILTGSQGTYEELFWHNRGILPHQNMFTNLSGGKIGFTGPQLWFGIVDTLAPLFHDPGLEARGYMEIDKRVMRNLFQKDENISEYRVMIAHVWGFDVMGHQKLKTSGAEFDDKFKEYVDIVTNVYDKVQGYVNTGKWGRTLLIFLSDHGQDQNGYHGPGTFEETHAFQQSRIVLPETQQIAPVVRKALEDVTAFWSSQRQVSTCSHITNCLRNQWLEKLHRRKGVHIAWQTDIAPTVSILLGQPIPSTSIGVVIPEMLLQAAASHPEICANGTLEFDDCRHELHKIVFAALRVNARHFEKHFGFASPPKDQLPRLFDWLYMARVLAKSRSDHELYNPHVVLSLSFFMIIALFKSISHQTSFVKLLLPSFLLSSGFLFLLMNQFTRNLGSIRIVPALFLGIFCTGSVLLRRHSPLRYRFGICGLVCVTEFVLLHFPWFRLRGARALTLYQHVPLMLLVLLMILSTGTFILKRPGLLLLAALALSYLVHCIYNDFIGEYVGYDIYGGDVLQSAFPDELTFNMQDMPFMHIWLILGIIEGLVRRNARITILSFAIWSMFLTRILEFNIRIAINLYFVALGSFLRALLSQNWSRTFAACLIFISANLMYALEYHNRHQNNLYFNAVFIGLPFFSTFTAAILGTATTAFPILAAMWTSVWIDRQREALQLPVGVTRRVLMMFGAYHLMTELISTLVHNNFSREFFVWNTAEVSAAVVLGAWTAMCLLPKEDRPNVKRNNGGRIRSK